MVFMVKIDPAPILPPILCGEQQRSLPKTSTSTASTPFTATSKTVAFQMDTGCFQNKFPIFSVTK